MRCLYCGKELALLKRWTSGGEFCSDAHRQQYQDEYNQLALNRLLQAKPPIPAAEEKALPPKMPAGRVPQPAPSPGPTPRAGKQLPAAPLDTPAAGKPAPRIEASISVPSEPIAEPVAAPVAAPVALRQPEPPPQA